MPDCPSGSHIKPEVLEEQFWITVGDALEQLEGVLSGIQIQFFAQIMQQVAPSLIDLNELCTKPPPVPQTISLDEIILSGQWNSIPHWLATWFWDTYQTNRWSAFCECNASTGPGPCPDIPSTHHLITSSRNQGNQLLKRVPAPRGWTTCTVTWTRGDDTMPGRADMGYEFYNAAGVRQGSTVAINTESIFENITDSRGPLPIGAGGDVNTVTEVGFYAMPGAGFGNVNSTVYSFALDVVATFQGTCQDTTITPPPPTPPPPPADPTVPLPPVGPIGCSTDTLCSMLYQVQRELHELVVRFNAAQRYGLPFSYDPGTQHLGLSGSGSFAISGLCGIRVDITSPLPERQLEGTPPYIWDLGWMSVLTADGMIEEKRITRDTQLWQPRMIQEATVFGYHFKDAISATVTELYPEPY